MEEGGEVKGIIKKLMIEKEERFEREKEMREIIIVEDMNERKKMMLKRYEDLVKIKGGIGKVEEIVEMMKWEKIGKKRKKMVLENIKNLWKKMMEIIENMSEEGLINKENKVKKMIVWKRRKI